MTIKATSIPVTGMSCANCSATVERKLSKVQGVQHANVNFASERAEVSYESSEVNLKALVDEVRKAGFDVATARLELPITGMSCANCSATVERSVAWWLKSGAGAGLCDTSSGDGS